MTSDIDELNARVRADIEEHGWHVAMIGGDEQAPPWAFSIGFSETLRHPEVVVFGLETETAHRLLNHVGLLVRQGARYEADKAYEGILEDRLCAFRSVAPRWVSVFLGNASWYYQNDEIPALQCFWPDPANRYPWDPAFDPTWRDRQPCLYEAQEDLALSPSFARVLRDEGAL